MHWIYLAKRAFSLWRFWMAARDGFRTVPGIFWPLPNIWYRPQTFHWLDTDLCDNDMFKISAFQTATSCNLYLLWSCPSIALLCLVRTINLGDTALCHFYANIFMHLHKFFVLKFQLVLSLDNFVHLFTTLVFNLPA